MAQRVEAKDSLDDFPTPPWATRALLEHVIGTPQQSTQICWEPACGRGHMSKVLWEYFGKVRSTDAHDYGYGDVADYLATKPPRGGYDWLITNPPFRLAEQFIARALDTSKWGVAVIVRTAFLESVGRYNTLFSRRPPSHILQFAERVVMHKGKLAPNGSTATAYCWLVWRYGQTGTEFGWIAPCRKRLERPGDYPVASQVAP